MRKNKNTMKKIVIAAAASMITLAIFIGMILCFGQIRMLQEQLREQNRILAEVADKSGVSASANVEVSVSWAGKKWASYGDSITEMAGWQEYITDYFGFAEHVNCGIGSTTFTKSDLIWYANPDGSYNSRYGFLGITEAPDGTTEHVGYLASEDRIQTQLPSDLDLVVIMGGTNDAGITVSAPIGDMSYPFDETTFKGAVAAAVVRVQKQCPNALVVLASPLSGRGPETEDKKEMTDNQTEPEYNALELTTQDYAVAMREVAEALSVPFIDVFGNTGINSFNRNQYIADIVHPNEAGKQAIARVMIGALDDLKPVSRKQ